MDLNDLSIGVGGINVTRRTKKWNRFAAFNMA